MPVIGNVRPSGTTYLMEDFHDAGGIRALMERVRAHLDADALTCTGRTLGENIAGARVVNDDVIRPLEDFVTERVRGGQSILGLHPMTDEAKRPLFEAWRAATGR